MGKLLFVGSPGLVAVLFLIGAVVLQSLHLAIGGAILGLVAAISMLIVSGARE